MNKISVIIPVYNAEKTLRRCLDSVFSQTYKNIEVLCIDDGSGDRSLEILKEYAAHESRLTVIKKAHSGVSAARNAGLLKMHGDFVQFTDADDYMEPDMLESLLKMLLEADADIAVCNYTHPSLENTLGNRILDFSNPQNYYEYYQNTFACHIPWNKLYRRDILVRMFDEELAFCEDGLFSLENMARARRLVSTDRMLYHYCVLPPDTDPEELSCINKIANAPNFWETGETYWYLLRGMKEKFDRAVDRGFTGSGVEEELKAERIFDFLLWEILILGTVGVDENGLKLEVYHILSEPDFMKSLLIKERYGLQRKPFFGAKLKAEAAEFTEECLCALKNDARVEGSRYKKFLALFSERFLEPNGRPLDPKDYAVRAYLRLHPELFKNESEMYGAARMESLAAV